MIKKSLGKGISALFSTVSTAQESLNDIALIHLPLEQVMANPQQPRQHFAHEKIVELAESIKRFGMMQPIVVCKGQEGQYLIIAGERRWRAAKHAGLERVPCIEKELSKEELFAAAVVENLQRENLKPMEEAESYRKLTEELGYSQAQVAQMVAKDRSTITNAIRLLKLPQSAQKLLNDEQISMGHARALLALQDEKSIEELAKKIQKEKLSVRQTEEFIQRLRAPKKEKELEVKNFQREEKSNRFFHVRRELEKALQTKVEIEMKKNEQGSLTIYFDSKDKLSELIASLCSTDR